MSPPGVGAPVLRVGHEHRSAWAEALSNGCPYSARSNRKLTRTSSRWRREEEDEEEEEEDAVTDKCVTDMFRDVKFPTTLWEEVQALQLSSQQKKPKKNTTTKEISLTWQASLNGLFLYVYVKMLYNKPAVSRLFKTRISSTLVLLFYLCQAHLQ